MKKSNLVLLGLFLVGVFAGYQVAKQFKK